MKIIRKIMVTILCALGAAIIIEYFFIHTICYNLLVDDVVEYTVHEADILASELEKDAEFIDERSKQTVQRAVVLYCFSTQRDHASNGCDYVLLDGSESIYNNTGIDNKKIIDMLTESQNIIDGISYEILISNAEGKELTYCIAGRTIHLVNRDYEIAVVRDITQQMNAIHSLNTAFLIVSFLVAVAMLFLVYKAVGHFMRPMKALKLATERIAEGKMKSRVTITSKDELGELGVAFNDMATALEYYIDQIQGITNKQDMLLHSIAHELRTPVMSITGYAFALRKAKLNQEQTEEALAFIYKESFRLQSLVEQLTKLMHLNSNRIELSFVEINKLEGIVSTLLQPRARESGANLKIETESDVEIYGERDLLVMLITNFFNNALKAEASEITIIIDHEKIMVVDNGSGISEQDIEKLTQPFYQTDASRNQEGFGLGLTFCQRIAQIHHSSIQISSEEGKGSKFSMPVEKSRKICR